MLARYYRSFWDESRAPIRHAVRDSLVWVRDRLGGEHDRRGSEHLEFPPLADWLACQQGRPLRALEVGAGPAGFSRALERQHHRLRAEVVEPAEDFAVLYRLSGIRRVSPTRESVPMTASYDLIHASHVVEHLVDLHAAMSKMRAQLREDGAVMIEVPNCEDPYWQYRYYPDPPHVQFFTPESLKLALEEQGFAQVEVKTCAMPIESEREVGYLHPGTPECVPRVERVRLVQERAVKAARPPAVASPSAAYADHGREFIRAAAMASPPDPGSRPAT
jgi:SAM-dependent methyltransferase